MADKIKGRNSFPALVKKELPCPGVYFNVIFLLRRSNA